MTKRISLVLGFALAFASAMFAHAADSGLTANTPNWVAINTGQASGDESPSLSSAADYTAYFCTVETAKQLFGGAATVEAITGYLSDHYETGKTALRTSGTQLNTSSYDLGQYSFVKYFETAPAVADYLGIIFYDGDDGSEFRVFGSDNAKRDEHWVVFDDNTSGVGEWVKLTDMAVSVTDWKGTYDSESHSAMVMVTEPAMGYTITWDDTSTGATGPAYTDAGFYTNVFTVTADGYFDFVGTGVVEIAKAEVTLAWGSTELSYTGAPQVPSALLTGVLTGDEVAPVVTGAITGPEADGTATVTGLSGAHADNYVLTGDNLETDFTIGEYAGVIVKLTSEKLEYTGAPLDPGIELSGIDETVTPDMCDFVWTDLATLEVVDAPRNAGTYELRVSRKTGYDGKYVTATFEVGVKPAVLIWGETKLEYTGAEQAPSVTLEGFVEGDVVVLEVSGARTEVGGPYTATVKLSGDDLANYAVTGETSVEFEIYDPIIEPDYFLLDSDAQNTSSMSGLSSPKGWTATRGGTTRDVDRATDPTKVYGITGGYQLRTPTSGSYTFQGKTLVVENGTISHKLPLSGTNVMTINDLVVQKDGSCKYALANGVGTHRLAGHVTINAGGVFKTELTETSKRDFECQASIAGPGTLLFYRNTSSGTDADTWLKGDNSELTGRIVVTNRILGVSFSTAASYPGDTKQPMADGIEINNSSLLFEASGTIGPNRGIAVTGTSNSRIAVKTGETLTISSPLTGASTANLHFGNSTHKGDVVLSDASAGFEGSITVDYGTLYLVGDAAALYSKCKEISPGKVVIVEPKGPVVAAVANYSGIYDGAAHHATVTVSEPTEGYTITWDDNSTGVNGPNYTNAGSYTNVFTVTAFGYDDFVGTGVVEIDPVELTLAWGPTDLAYTGLAQAPAATLDGVYEGDDVAPVVDGAAVESGDHTATVTGLSGADAANYMLTGETSTSFTIAEYAGVILALDLSEATYTGGVIDPGIHISGAGEIVTPEMCVFAWTNLETGVGVDAPSAAGTYELTVSRKDGYEGKSVTATFVIHRRDAYLVWGATVLLYTGEMQAPTVELQGLVLGDDVTTEVTGAAKMPGSYTAKVVLGGAALPNYNISGLTQVAFEIESPDVLLTAENGLITVKVLAGVVPVKAPLILTWDDADQGDEPDNWTHQITLDVVTAAGGTFKTNGFDLAIADGTKVKAFIVQDCEFYESLTKSQSATGVIVLDYIPKKSKNTSGIDISAKFTGTYQNSESFFCGVSDISSGVQQWIRIMSGGTDTPPGVQMWAEEQYYSASHTKWGVNDPNRLKEMKDFVGRTGTKPTWGGTASDGSNAWAADINYDYVDPLSVFGRIVRTATSVTTNSYAMWDITIGRVSIYEKPGSTHNLVANYVPAKIGGDFGLYNTVNDNFCAATSNDGFSTEKAATNSLHGTIAMSLVEVYAIDTTKVSAVVEDCEVIYDGEQHANTLWVLNPQTGWTATWRNAAGAVLPSQPSYIETGVFTNFVEVTADTLTPFVGTGVVTIAKINLETDVTVDSMPPFLATGNPIHPTPIVRYKQTGNVVATSDLNFEYLGGDCIEPGEYTIRITGKAGRNHAEGIVEIPFTIFNGKYYVATDGSDETGDGSKDDPYATIARGLVAARVGYNEHAGSGDFRPTVVVAPGTYAEKYILLDFPVVIQGLGEARGANAEDGAYVNCKTVNDDFIFKLDHESAVLENVRIHTTHDYNTCGYNLYLVKGTVRYCNVTGGTLNQKNAYMTGGRMEDTWISGGNRVNSENPGDAINLYMSGGTAARLKITGGIGGNSVHLYNNAVLENSLITGFARHSNSDKPNVGYGHVVTLEGSSKMVNCSVVNNTGIEKASRPAIGAVRAIGTSKAINCVIYGNPNYAGEDTPELEWGGSTQANFVNCAFGAGLAPAAGTACIDTVTDADFAYYAGGDYTPTARGALENVGDTELYWQYATSETDLAGRQRISNNVIDIGCYEQATWSVEATLTGGAYSHDGQLHSALLNISYPDAGAGCSTNWTWSDGTDGHPLPEDYVEIGIYTNSVVVEADGLEPFTATTVVKILDFDGTNYVAKTGSDDGDGTKDSPYKTLSHAVNVSRGLFEKEGYRQTITIRVEEGEYADSGMTLDWPIRIRGNVADPSRVVINDDVTGQCAFTLAHPDARVEGLTITGQGRRGGTGSQGGHVLMTDGTVADCVIANGIAMQNNTGSGYGGNVYMEGGALLRCVITNGMITLSGTATTQQGGNVYAAGGLVANCLIAGGQSVSTKKSSDSAVGVQGVGLYLAGSATAVNCTIANNSATLADSPAGVYVADASAQVINCVIYNNRAADKDTAVTEWGCVQADSYTCCAVIDPAEIVGGVDNRADLTSTNFVDAAGGDFHFVAGSILQDIGSLARYRELMAEFPKLNLDLDLDRKPRICRMFTGSPERIDVGAYERSTVDRINATFTGVDVPYDGLPHWAFLSIHAPAGGAYCTTTWTWSDGTEHVDEAETCTKPGQYVNRVVVRADASLQLPLFRGVVTNIIRDINLSTGVRIDPDPLPVYPWTGEVIHPEPKVILKATGDELSRAYYTYEYIGDCTSLGRHTVRVVPQNQFVTGKCEAEFFIFNEECHVATTGSDETGDGTKAKPFATISNGLAKARSAFENGGISTTVYVKPGTYTEKGLLLDFPVAVQGEGDARTDTATDGVSVDCKTVNDDFIFKLDHESAVLENVRIHTTHDYNTCGYNLYLANGTVRCCNVTGGTLDQKNVNMTGGRLEDTWISGGNRVNSENPGVANNLYMSGGTAARLKITGGIGGCGVHLYNAAALENSLITGFSRYHHDKYNNGKGYAVQLDSTSSMVNCTVVGNKGGGDGMTAFSAVFVAATAKASDCVIYGNANSAGEDSAALEWGGTQTSFVNCAFGEGFAPAGGVSCFDTVTDAAFKDYTNGDYMPARGGAIFNTGLTWEAYLATGATSDKDLKGKSRLVGDRLDVGCYELHDPGTVIFFK